MASTTHEWMRQAEYDLGTAQAMFDKRRYFYAVFMCHLSLEKALKGLYLAKLRKTPPKVHDLVFLREALSLPIEDPKEDFLFMLSRLSVLTRYPEEIRELMKEFPRSKTSGILVQTKEILQWLKRELRKS